MGKNIEYEGVNIKPLIAQPQNDGIIEKPLAGKWTFIVSRIDNNGPDVSRVTFEIYKKYENPEIADGGTIRLFGAGVEIKHIIDKNNPDKTIKFTQKEKGVLQITNEYYGISKTQVRRYRVN